MNRHKYWVIRDNCDTAIELVRATPKSNVVVAGEGKGNRQHKHSRYFTKDNKPILDNPLTFQLIHAGDASAPAIGKAIDEVESALWFKQQRTTRRKQYAVKDAQLKALSLLDSGSSIREAARLCGVPKSTVADWRAA